MTVEEPPTALSVGLSPEEVFYLLDHLNVSDLPGVDRQPFARLQPEQQQLALAVAERSLLARALLLPEDGAFSPNPLLLTLLAPSVSPEHSLLIWHQPAGEPGRLYYGHCWQDVYVLRWQTDQGIQQFLRLASRDAFAQAVVGLLPTTWPAAEGPAHRLPAAEFEQAQADASASGAAAALARLQAGGLPPETAAALAADMAAPKTIVSVVGTHHAPENGASGLALTVIEGQAAAWLADYDEAAEGQVVLRPAPAGAIEARLRAFIAAF